MNYSSIAEELKNGRTVTYFTLGVSMRPLLRERQTHVMMAPLVQVSEGDILLYIRRGGAYVLHRCIRQEEEYLYMRGDNTYGLEQIRKEQAIGVVTHIYRNGRTFSVENKWYQWYVRFWNISYPLRELLWKVRRNIGKRKRNSQN